MFDKLDTEFRINLLKYRNLSECSTEEIIEEVYDYITIKRYSSNTADMLLYAWGLHFLKCHVKNKQQWGSLVYLIKKKKKKERKKRNVQKNYIRTLHSWISRCTGFHSKYRTLKFWGQGAPRKGILGTEFKKAIVNLEISTTKYSLAPSFISNKAIWNLRTKFVKKKLF